MLRFWFIILFVFSLCGCATSLSSKAVSANLNARLGIDYADEGLMPLAKEKIILALTQDPHSALANLAMGYFEVKRKNSRYAHVYYQRAIRYGSNSPEVLSSAAIFYCNQGKVKQALTLWQKSIALPNNYNTEEDKLNEKQCLMRNRA